MYVWYICVCRSLLNNEWGSTQIKWAEFRKETEKCDGFVSYWSCEPFVVPVFCLLSYCFFLEKKSIWSLSGLQVQPKPLCHSNLMFVFVVSFLFCSVLASQFPGSKLLLLCCQAWLGLRYKKASSSVCKSVSVSLSLLALTLLCHANHRQTKTLERR